MTQCDWCGTEELPERDQRPWRGGILCASCYTSESRAVCSICEYASPPAETYPVADGYGDCTLVCFDCEGWRFAATTGGAA